MADSRGTLTGIEKRKWKALRTLGDVQRGLASVIVRMNAGRLAPDVGRAMIAGLKDLGALYEGRLERSRGVYRGATSRPLAEVAREYLEEMAEDPEPETTQ